ncbi:hypothetical protein [Planococcus sp. NCCP-2050]|uniref:hypothetical protein n=1 Tax=Planococcus sp. NCCP-2050 TaxID=2944679 RepID=UPI00203BE015|nr:hypothetical protein [Planococcus sp. NCCP-2050]GKW45963.1 hypothetical protein NCCP2050_16550 [Planococcus sp. NCCP-2050]
MELLVLAVYIALLSFAAKLFAGNKSHRWIHAGYLTAFLLPIPVWFLFMNIAASVTGGGISASIGGFVHAAATVITGFVFLYIGYTSKKVQHT